MNWFPISTSLYKEDLALVWKHYIFFASAQTGQPQTTFLFWHMPMLLSSLVNSSFKNPHLFVRTSPLFSVHIILFIYLA